MKKVLAVKWRQLGDTVLWTASLQALINMKLDVEIAYPMAFSALFQNDPRFPVQHFIENGPPVAKGYSAVLNFHASPSSEAFCKKTSAEHRVIHHHSRIPIKGGSTLKIPSLGVPMPATERDLNVARALGYSGQTPDTKIYVSERDRKNAASVFRDSAKPWLLLAPEASRPSKEWPLEYYVEVAKALRPKFSIAFLAQRSVQVKTDPRYQELLSYAQYIPTPSLAELIAAVSHTQQFLGSDSGVKHLAVALGVKTTTLFGPESIGEWHCYKGHVALQVRVGCRDKDVEPSEYAWCDAEYCPLASHACLRLIRPEEVVKVLQA